MTDFIPDDRHAARDQVIPANPFVLVEEADRQCFACDMRDNNEQAVLLFASLDDAYDWQKNLKQILGKPFVVLRFSIAYLAERFSYGSFYLRSQWHPVEIIVVKKEER